MMVGGQGVIATQIKKKSKYIEMQVLARKK